MGTEEVKIQQSLNKEHDESSSLFNRRSPLRIVKMKGGGAIYGLPYILAGWKSCSTSRAVKARLLCFLAIVVLCTRNLQTVFMLLTGRNSAHDLVHDSSFDPPPGRGRTTSLAARSVDETRGENDHFDISFVSVLSMQRSGSTFLANHILAPGNEDAWTQRRNPPLSECPYEHFIALNEIFQHYEEQSGDAWTIDGADLLRRNGDRQVKIRHLDVDELVAFLLRVAERKCQYTIKDDKKKKQLRTSSSNKTSNYGGDGGCPYYVNRRANQVHRCFVVFKQFDDQLRNPIHESILKYLPNLRVVILERNVDDRWRSWWFANETGDWDANGSVEHKNKLPHIESSGKAGNTTMTIPPVPEWFQYKHKKWYNFIDMLFTTEQKGHLSYLPHIKVQYQDVIEDALKVRERALKTILLPPPTLERTVQGRNVDEGDSFIVRAGGFYDHYKKRRHPTGSFVKCRSPSLNSSSFLDEEEESSHHRLSRKQATPHAALPPGVSSEKITVSCLTFEYRYLKDSFHKSGSIITGVLSSAKSSKRRQVIRETWANGYGGVFFLVAGSWSDIETEFYHYKDLVWIDREDAYYRITEKTASFIHLVDRVATSLNLDYQYAFKTDDDTYVALDRLIARLNWISVEKKPPDFWGSCSPQQVKPLRDQENIWSMTLEEYPGERYPEYCQGAGFALSRRFVRCAASVDNMSPMRYMKFEDVFVGMLAERCKISAIYDDFHMFARVKRSGRRQPETQKESLLRQKGSTSKQRKGHMFFPRADMAGRIYQHYVLDDQDMKDYHASYLLQKTLGLAQEPKVRDRVQFFYDDEGFHWLGATVVGIRRQDMFNRIEVDLEFDIDGSVETFDFDELYSGRWRREIPLTSYYKFSYLYDSLSTEASNPRKSSIADNLTQSLLDVQGITIDQLLMTTKKLESERLRFFVYDDVVIRQGLTIHKEEKVFGGLKAAHLEKDMQAEAQVLKALESHHLRTADPTEADFFVVPTPISKMLSSGCRWDDCSWYDDAIEALLAQPAYKESSGKNHVLLSLNWLAFSDRFDAYVPALSRNFKKIRNLTVAHHYDPFGAQVLAQTTVDGKETSEGFQMLYPLESPVTNAFCLGLGHDQSMPLVFPAEGKFRDAEFFLFYHSRDTDKAPFGFGSSKYRNAILFNTTVINRLPPSSIGNDVPKDTWLASIRSSRFCLVVRGDSPHSHSLLYSVRAGCIPVVVSNDYQEYAGPLKSSLSMKEFCIFIKENDFLSDPLRELQQLMALSSSTIKTLLESLGMVQRILFADHPESILVPAFLTELKNAQKNQLVDLISRYPSEVVDDFLKVGEKIVQYRYSKRIESRTTTDGGQERPRIVVVVLSQADRASHRRSIRQTWAKGFRTIFVISDGSWDDLSEEFAEDGDILWIEPGDVEGYDKTKLGVLTAFSFIASHIEDYDYVLRNDDGGFVFLPHAEQVLNNDPHAYWGVCDVSIEANGEIKQARVSNFSPGGESGGESGEDVEIVFENRDRSRATVSINQLLPSELGYFLSRGGLECLMGQIESSSDYFAKEYHIPDGGAESHWRDAIGTRALLAKCGLFCENHGFKVDKLGTHKRQSFAASGLNRSGEMLFHFWDAQKVRRIGEWSL